MAQSIVGLENVQPYKFSECSRNDYIDLLRNSHGGCMMNKPNEVSVQCVVYNVCRFIYVAMIFSEKSNGKQCVLHEILIWVAS